MLRLGFVDFWASFDPKATLSSFLELVKDEAYVVDDPQDADILICSVFGHTADSYSKPRIVLNWESRQTSDIYEMKFQNFFSDSEKSVWCPLLLDDTKRIKAEFYDVEPIQPVGFASAIFSNRTPLRMLFMKRLLENCPDQRFLIAGSNPFKNEVLPMSYDQFKKLQWLHDNRCVFHICPENRYKRGYITEKIRDAYMTHHIPVYWGCLDGLEEYLPSGSFIHIDSRNMHDTIKEMVDVYKNPERQAEMLSKAPIEKLCEETAQEIMASSFIDFVPYHSRARAGAT